MTDDLEEIDGVGPARSDSMDEMGYSTYADLAQVDNEQLAEDIPNLSEDRALEIIVQAQNLAELEEAEVSESDEGEETDESDSEPVDAGFDDSPSAEDEIDSDADESVSDESDDYPESVEVDVSFDNETQYDTFFNAVFETRNNYIRTNRGEQVESFERVLDSTRDTTPESGISVEMEPQELHDLHNEIKQQVMDYRGKGMMEQHDELQNVLNAVDEVREEKLF